MGAYAFMNLSKKAFRMRRSSKLVSVLGISEKWKWKKKVLCENLTHIWHIILTKVEGVDHFGCWSCSFFKDSALNSHTISHSSHRWNCKTNTRWKLHFHICKLWFLCAHAEAWERKQFWSEETQNIILTPITFYRTHSLVTSSSKITE